MDIHLLANVTYEIETLQNARPNAICWRSFLALEKSLWRLYSDAGKRLNAGAEKP
jgi:hypothetical protein